MATANVRDLSSHSGEKPTFHKDIFQKGPLKEAYLSGIAVDHFIDFNRSTSYFLTHVHTDHTRGLESEEFADYLKQHDFKLYCSEGTWAFITRMHPQLIRQTVVLDLGKPTAISVSPLPSAQSNGDRIGQPYQVTVTAFDANHCFGSIGFLFEREMGNRIRRVLYTGDVRMDDAWFSALRGPGLSVERCDSNSSAGLTLPDYHIFYAFHNSDGGVKPIDVVYLDATFNQHPTLPSKAQTCKKLVDLIEQYRRHDDNFSVALSLTAQYTAEHIIKEIYRRTGLQVNVENDVYHVYAQDKHMRKCITVDPQAKVYARRLNSSSPLSAKSDDVSWRRFADLIAVVTKSQGIGFLLSTAAADILNPCLQLLPEQTRVLVIRPSAQYFLSNHSWDDSKEMTCDYESVDAQSRHKGVRVLASSHSSGDELREFLCYIQPNEVRLMHIPSLGYAERILAYEITSAIRHIGDSDHGTTAREIGAVIGVNTEERSVLSAKQNLSNTRLTDKFHPSAAAVGDSTSSSGADAATKTELLLCASAIQQQYLSPPSSTTSFDQENSLDVCGNPNADPVRRDWREWGELEINHQASRRHDHDPQRLSSRSLLDYSTADVDYVSRLIDSHCHVDLLFDRTPTFKVDYGDSQRGTTIGEYRRWLIGNPFPQSFEGCIAVFSDPTNFADFSMWTRILGDRETNVWGAFGCHPLNASKFNHQTVENISMALDNNRVVALGEIGLDYSDRNYCDKEAQKSVLARQLQMAVERQKPVVIHCHDADDDCLRIIKQYVPHNYRIHRHGYTGSSDAIQPWLDYYTYLFVGFTPLITRPSATEVHDTVRRMPINRLLFETDAPYFYPRKADPPPRNERKNSHPGMVIHTAAQMAQLRGDDYVLLADEVYHNTKTMYGLY